MTLPRSGLSSWISMAALAASIALLLIPLTGRPAPSPASGLALADEGMPRALSQHLERLAQTIPGNGGHAEGPGADAEQAFDQRAYPGDTITVAQMEAARAAYGRLQGRPFPAGKGRPGTWVSVGPSQALYPDTIFRSSFSYVPNDYYAGAARRASRSPTPVPPGAA